MRITACKGYELEKERPNTSEDFFNRSEVIFDDEGKEKTFHVLYIRYFDEVAHEFTPFSSDPIFKVEDREVNFKDIVGLVCILKNPGFKNRKRIYINTQKEIADYFSEIDFDKLSEIFHGLEKEGSYTLESPNKFINQAL